MSNTKREPLKEQDILDVCERYADNYPIEGRITVNSRAMRRAVEPLVEAARAKDAELIQQLVDAVAIGNVWWYTDHPNDTVEGFENRQKLRDAIAAAEAAGFKPSRP